MSFTALQSDLWSGGVALEGRPVNWRRCREFYACPIGPLVWGSGTVFSGELGSYCQAPVGTGESELRSELARCGAAGARGGGRGWRGQHPVSKGTCGSDTLHGARRTALVWPHCRVQGGGPMRSCYRCSGYMSRRAWRWRGQVILSNALQGRGPMLSHAVQHRDGEEPYK